MSSAIRRKSRDRSLKNDKSANSKLRMDSKAPTPRITDPSLPAGRRREIDNVMKKARARAVSPTQNAYWDKKLLEVEAKDPNRWRHSGFKSLYVDGSSSPSPGRRSRSRSQRRATPPGRRSPPTGRRSPATGRRSPQSRPAASGRRSPVPGRRSPRSPPSRRSPVRARSPGSRRSPLAYRTSSPQRRSPATAPRARPRSPPPKSAPRRSASRSSISSCSDDSCSVCSPKNPRTKRSSRSRSFSVPRSRDKHAASKAAHEKASKVPNRPRPPSPKSPAPRRMPRPMTPPTASGPSKMRPRLPPSDRPTDPRRQPPPPRPRVGRTGKVIDVSGVKPPPKTGKKPKEPGAQPMMLKRIKKEKTKKRPGSPGGESSSSDESTSSMNHIVATTGITLSERFGKIAQWSADRERREIENMRITKTGADLKVMIEEDDLLYGSPSRRTSPLPGGHVPDDIMSSGNSKRLAAWDDVRVRYQYYKELGYLRDLTLDDYIKWEEWWYKYQDWLANERHYERWVNNQSHRRRRKRIPASQRLN